MYNANSRCHLALGCTSRARDAEGSAVLQSLDYSAIDVPGGHFWSLHVRDAACANEFAYESAHDGFSFQHAAHKHLLSAAHRRLKTSGDDISRAGARLGVAYRRLARCADSIVSLLAAMPQPLLRTISLGTAIAMLASIAILTASCRRVANAKSCRGPLVASA